jgi:hypothetical protein
MTDQQEIRQLVENWALWRDSGKFDRLATVWLPEGRMMTTWCNASAAEFIARSRKAFADGIKGIHVLGGTSIDIAGTRAIAQTRMQILQRAPCHGVLVDVCCTGRFWDAFEKRAGHWGLLLRQPVYELDQMIPVDPAATVKLEAELLQSFPEGYRNLAYLQTQLGFTVGKGLPGTRGPAIEALEERGRRWLAGEDSAVLMAN